MRIVAALLIGMVSCSDAQPTVETNVTGINLTITFEPRLELDQLEVSCVAGGETVFTAEPIPEEARELNPAGEVLAILFDDDRADITVDLTVDGYAAGVHVASESTQVALVLHEMVNARVSLTADCVAATDCTSPGPCELPDDPQCEAGVCVYTPASAGTVRCALPGETELDGYCVDGVCVECSTRADCVDAPGDHPECYDAACDNYTCVYSVVASRVCLPVSCSNGTVQNQRTCGDGGDCADTGTTGCDGYVCATDATSCRTTCSEDAHCAAGYYCSSPSCVPTLANGEICAGVGDRACASGYCDGTRCCTGGDCCGDAADCPASYSQASTCTDTSNATTCQGTRREAACSSNHVCYTETLDDDSGCVGLERSCGTIAPVACSGQQDQPVASCPADCTTVGCIDGYECIGTSCVQQVGLGDACTGGPGQGSCEPGYKCDQDICCSAAISERCCETSADCANGLKCNTAQFYCYESCTPHTSDECAATSDYCSDGTQCVTKLPNGDSCVAGGDCQLGNCVEIQTGFGVCCETDCTGMCLSCRGSYTGDSDGLCRPVSAGQPDIGPPDLCSATTTPCGASSCACDGGGNCELANNMPCTTADECASGFCECADSTCDPGQKKCSAVSCPSCRFNANGDATCEGNIGDTETDGSCGVLTCNGQGACHLDDGEVCTNHWECESDSCNCDGSCTCGPPPCPSADLGSAVGIDVVVDSTSGEEDLITPSCVGVGTAPEKTYLWTAPNAGRFDFEVINSYDSLIFALDGSCSAGERACVDFYGDEREERMSLLLANGEAIVLGLDGYGGDSGDFRLNVWEMPLAAAYWPFNEGSGPTLFDDSANGNHGTIDGPSWRTYDEAYGHSLEFDGNNDMITVPNSPSIDIGGTGLTLVMWVKIVDTSSDYVILCKPWEGGGVFNNPFFQYGIEFQGSSKRTILYLADETSTYTGFGMSVEVGTTIADAPWAHVVYTYDGTTVKGYMNRTEVLSTSYSGEIQVRGTPFYMGADPRPAQHFHGRMDEVRIFDRALTPAEIALLP